MTTAISNLSIPIEVQPPTPLMGNNENTSSFSDYANQEEDEHQQQDSNNASTRSINNQGMNFLQATQPTKVLRRDNSTTYSGSSFDLTAGDETASNHSIAASNKSSYSNRSRTHDPYLQRSRNSSFSNTYSSEAMLDQQQYPLPTQQQQMYDNSIMQQQYNQYQDQQQYPVQQQQMQQGYNNNYNAQQQQMYNRSPVEQQYGQYDAQQQYPQYDQQQQYQQAQQMPPSLQLARNHQQMQHQRSASNENLFPQQQQQQPMGSSFVSHNSTGSNSSRTDSPVAESAPNQSNAAASSKPFPECCYHKALVNRLEFIQPPTVTQAGAFTPNSRSNNYLRVFVGQCRFESTPAEVRWLIHYLTGVQPVKVELRGTGCFMAYVQNYEEVYQVLQLKEKLLFDHTGVWYARDEEQASFLRRYVSSYVSSIGKGFRLPKDMMVLHDQQQREQQQQQNGNGKSHHHHGKHHHGRGHNQHREQQHSQRSAVNNFYQQ